MRSELFYLNEFTSVFVSPSSYISSYTFTFFRTSPRSTSIIFEYHPLGQSILASYSTKNIPKPHVGTLIPYIVSHSRRYCRFINYESRDTIQSRPMGVLCYDRIGQTLSPTRMFFKFSLAT